MAKTLVLIFNNMMEQRNNLCGYRKDYPGTLWKCYIKDIKDEKILSTTCSNGGAIELTSFPLNITNLIDWV
ncbi:hypothetical protein EV200_109136 [Pedobacter psychrotolerans]|uniref:Uncharacterized protein n=1 Tax=Pedobacter psychrotolerans TaxID=1843235 RepID=A0A4R2H732_9SPHI|nr:hypothetical protein [Pedobacter psychrotolerans]TCO19952.1 hypothetical protein EV200_109136 [Pedobacter psychrotolerans]